MHPSFIQPKYDAGGFAGLPSAIVSFFSGQERWAQQYPTVENLVFCFVDGFGWRHFEKFGSHAFLDQFSKDGRVSKLTSQFPSTTAAHVTCMHTGLNVGESGVFEWIYYEPSMDAIIAPLLFSYSGTTERDQLKKAGADPQRLYPTGTLYQRLAGLGVHSSIFQHREYTPSTYSNQVFQGALTRGYKSLPEGLTNLSMAVNQADGKNYFFLYYDRIDSISHEYGPDSLQVEAEVEMFMYVMTRHFLEKIHAKGKTLVLLSADHGQVEVDPTTTVYLNKAFPGIGKMFKTNRKGDPLVPAGSSRDMFLYIKDERLEEVHHLLSTGLTGVADVVKTEDLISLGYFGPLVSDRFRARVANLVVLPYRYQSVWWYEKGRFEQRYLGHHGGLTPQEMEIPLLELVL